EQLTAGGFGMSKAVKSMCCASLQTLTVAPLALHAYCAGVAPVGSGPYTSGGRRQMPALQVQEARPAARWGQSAAELHFVVQPLTTSDVSHAEVQSEPLEQGSSALTQ